jgi:hypothetical protein
MDNNFELTKDTIDMRFAEASKESAHIAMVLDMIRRGCSQDQALKVCVLTMHNVIDELVHKVTYLENIAPKLIETPEGNQYRYDVPSKFLEVIKAR